MPSLTPLPIDVLLPDIVAELRRGPTLVLEAPPGAGKTTRVPPALLDAGLAGSKEIVVLQPRRLATRLAAARVAQERGQRLGDEIGYQIRFEDVSSAKTRVRYVTEGVLTRRLVSEPGLPAVGIVVLDEFHERHLAGDLALAMLRQLQRTSRADLKLVAMSATLDAAPIARWLDAPVLRSEGRRFDVAVEHLVRDDDRHLDQQVLAALKRLIQAGLDGHVLVFLPGASEIRRAREVCEDLLQRHQLEAHVLHGDLPSSEQDRALRSTTGRKVIFSTNIAETSVTIDGVAAVVDSGVARVATHSPWSGLATLKVAKISKASATQRAGRAGRTRAGVCLRLYTRADFEARPPSDLPEIVRADLTEAALALHAMGAGPLVEFPFFEAPRPQAANAADALLRRLGALTPEAQLTDLGRRLLRFPTHPRVARLLVEGERRGVARDAAILAAVLGERDLRLEARARFSEVRGAAQSGPSDVLELVDRFKQGSATSPRAAGLDPNAFSGAERVRAQLARLLDTTRPTPSTEVAREEALLLSVLAGYPDRVAKRRKPRAPQLVLAEGGAATLDETSVVHDAELMVAVDAEERRGGVVVRLASRIEPEWLLDGPADQLSSVDALEWNDAGQRVERVTRLSFGAITLEETRGPAPETEETAALLAKAALAADRGTFVDLEQLGELCCRIDALRVGYPEAGFPLADPAWVANALREACLGRRSFAELKDASLLTVLRGRLDAKQVQLLATQAPERITLPSGRGVKVHYEPTKPPWIESRLQDFFGMTVGPSVGRAPVVLHLLAPNMRAVQVTSDLSGFWQRHYPAIRRELMRQYPKHAWPEDPVTAKPPAPRR